MQKNRSYIMKTKSIKCRGTRRAENEKGADDRNTRIDKLNISVTELNRHDGRYHMVYIVRLNQRFQELSTWGLDHSTS